MKNKRALGTLLLLLTAMIWGTAFVFQRMGMESIGPVTFTAARKAKSEAPTFSLPLTLLSASYGSVRVSIPNATCYTRAHTVQA